MTRPKVVPDPRPDLRGDTVEWTMLLTAAEAVDTNLAGVLHGFRCGGLRIHRGAKGYALRPEYDPHTSIWPHYGAYRIDRDQWLRPHGKRIVQLLNALDQAMRGETA